MDLPFRHPTHILEEKSRRAVRAIFPPEWVVRDVWPDYGVDMAVEIFRDGRPTGKEFYVQIKGTAAGAADNFSVRIERKSVNFLQTRPLPTLLVGYNDDTKRVYARWLREYVASLDYGQSSKRGGASIQVGFTPEDQISAESADQLLDYFLPAGVPAASVRKLLNLLPKSGAPDRYRILKELRFLRTADGALYLIKELALDLMHESTFPEHQVFADCVVAYLTTMFQTFSLPTTLLFWGAAAASVGARKDHFDEMSRHLFERLIRFVLDVPALELADQTQQLFGYSALAGVLTLRREIRSKDFGRCVDALVPRLEECRRTAAPHPRAPELFTALYTVEPVNGVLVYLTDSEFRRARFLRQKGVRELRARRPGLEKYDYQFGGYLEGLHGLFGYSLPLECAAEIDLEMETLRSSLISKKLDLFMKHDQHRSAMKRFDFKKLSDKEMTQYLASDLLTFHQVYWYGKALDHFQLDCYARRYLHGSR